MTVYVAEEELLLAHFKLIERYGGAHGIRDLERLRSVVAAPKQAAFGVEQYPDIFEKAAVYARNIIGDHAFVDGNKRTGISVALLFLQRNDRKCQLRPGELEDFAVRVATDRLDVQTIADWLRTHTTH